MYNLEQLRMFVEAAHTGSFSACARRLGKVQSAVSQGISHLEADLNLQLFDRSTRKPTLTAEGQRLLVHAQAVLLQTASLDSAVAAIGRREEALVRLALDSALHMPALNATLARFAEQFCATQIQLISLPSTDVATAVASGKADLGLMFSEIEINTEVDLGFIGNLPFHAVCSPAHPLAELSLVNVEALVPYRQLSLRGMTGKGLDMFPTLAADVWWANSFTALREWVLEGVGWAYLPCHMTADGVAQKRLHPLPLSFDFKPWSPPVDLIKPRHHPLGPTQRWLYEQLQQLLET